MILSCPITVKAFCKRHSIYHQSIGPTPACQEQQAAINSIIVLQKAKHPPPRHEVPTPLCQVQHQPPLPLWHCYRSPHYRRGPGPPRWWWWWWWWWCGWGWGWWNLRIGATTGTTAHHSHTTQLINQSSQMQLEYLSSPINMHIHASNELITTWPWPLAFDIWVNACWVTVLHCMSTKMAQAIFLLECRHTDTHTQSPYPSLGYSSDLS